jgi:hypothetical protein
VIVIRLDASYSKPPTLLNYGATSGESASAHRSLRRERSPVWQWQWCCCWCFAAAPGLLGQGSRAPPPHGTASLITRPSASSIVAPCQWSHDAACAGLCVDSVGRPPGSRPSQICDAHCTTSMCAGCQKFNIWTQHERRLCLVSRGNRHNTRDVLEAPFGRCCGGVSDNMTWVEGRCVCCNCLACCRWLAAVAVDVKVFIQAALQSWPASCDDSGLSLYLT